MGCPRSAAITHHAVRDYDATFAEREWQRLHNTADGALEYLITCTMLERFLPGSGRVLDLGGGPGRSTIWLAQRGYQVVLADLSPALLALAHQQITEAGVAAQIEAIVEANACDLSRWPESSFDAVLCLGPFYHLPDPHDRARATQELVRVLRPGAVVALAMMPRYALLRRTIALPDERQHLADPAWLHQLMEHGIFDNRQAGRFTHGYGVQPAEIVPFFQPYGLEACAVLSAESIVGDMQQAAVETLSADPTMRQTLLNLLIDAAHDPAILGMANHLLYIGRRSIA